jgi:precorrin-6B methylase 1
VRTARCPRDQLDPGRLCAARPRLDRRADRHGPPVRPEETPDELRGSPKLAILGGRDGSLRWAAGIIPELGEDRRVFLCEDLTMPTERVREVSAGDLTEIPVSARAIILVIRKELMS